MKIDTHGILEVQILNPDLDFWNSDLKILFWENFGRKSQSCAFFLKIGTRGIWTMLILIATLVFWISDPKSILWANFDQKSQSCPVWLQIATQSVWTMLILIPTLFFSVSNPKFFFGQIWAEKFKAVYFDWRLAHMVYRGCWFLFWQ